MDKLSPRSNKSWFLGLVAGFAVAAAFIMGAGAADADRKLANGADCKYSSDCASGDCDHGTCKPKSGGKLANGATCKYSSDCESGDCDHGSCKGRGSKTKLGNGMKCKYSSDCESGDCDRGTCKGR